MSQIRFLVILLCGMFILPSSCSLFKRAEKKEDKIYKDLRNLLAQQTIPYEWFSAKSNVDVNSPMGVISASFQMRIQKDSAIWVSASKFGFEAFRGLITRDSVFALNRFGRTYYAESIDSLSATYNFPGDLETLQEVLVGNPWMPDQIKPGYTYTPDSVSVTVNYLGFTIQHGCYTPMKQLDFTQVFDESGQGARIEYGDYKDLSGKYKIPYFRKYQITDSSGEGGTAAFNFKEVEIDVPQEMPFSIPKSYTKEKL